MPDVIVQTNVLYLVAFFFIVFVIREIVAFRKILKLKYVFTPLVTYLVIIIALYLSYVRGFNQYNIFIIAGLVFALIADTLLMIEEISFFIHGLFFFLLTHICYVYALSINYNFGTTDIIVGVVVLILFFSYYLLIHKAKGKLYFPIILYMLVLSLVMLIAIGTLVKNIYPRGAIVTIAAVLFAISDGVLAFNQFIRKIPHSTVVTWSLYAPAQLLFAFSCYY
ncbi:MAG: lysoplasmalogenase [Spirochaetes bacterium]|nr:lysoplasmalogenase [Spirochaetota bacterium]